MYPELRLRKGREKSVINRHPWVFSGGVGTAPEGAREGDIVRVTDARGRPLALGFYSKKSQIACRLFEFDRATAEVLPENYWEEKIRTAYALRQSWVIAPSTNACRLVHAEGDGLPGLIADAYDDTVVIQLLTQGVARLVETFAQAFRALGFRYVYHKVKQSTRVLEGVAESGGWIGESGEGVVEVREYGLRFKVDIEGGQKTGTFLDQREHREHVRRHAEGKQVLNAFSYTGGFSLSALAGGADHVVSADISADAIRLCEENIALNGYSDRHESVTADCFKFLREDTRIYDLIVVDPPAFAKNARSRDNACRGYKDVNLLAFRKAKPGGLVYTFSCSQAVDADLFQKVIFGAGVDAGRTIRILERFEQPADHPVSLYHPEGAYLKGLLLHVE